VSWNVREGRLATAKQHARACARSRGSARAGTPLRCPEGALPHQALPTLPEPVQDEQQGEVEGAPRADRGVGQDSAHTH